MKSHMYWLSGVAAIFAGSLSLAHAVDADDPSQWSCKDVQSCPTPKKTVGTIPDLPDKNQIVHIADSAKFRIVVGPSSDRPFEFVPATNNWPAVYLKARMTFVPHGHLLPLASCSSDALVKFLDPKVLSNRKKAALAKGVAAKNVKVLTAPPTDSFSHFASDPLPLHLTSLGQVVDQHVLSVYPLEPASPGAVQYCLMISDNDPGLHDGAVHTE